MTAFKMIEPVVMESDCAVGWIAVGQDAHQTAFSPLPSYWNHAQKTRFLGIDMAQHGEEGVSYSESGANIFLPIQNRRGLHDITSIRNAMSPYAKSAVDFLTGARLNAITAYLGKPFSSGVLPSIAEVSANAGAVTVAVVALPHPDEGRIHLQHSRFALRDLRDTVDTICAIPLDSIYKFLSGAGSVRGLEIDMHTMFSRIMRGILDLSTFRGSPSPSFDEILSFFKLGREMLVGYSPIMDSPSGALEAVRNALDEPLDSTRSFHGAEQVLVSVCLGTMDLDLKRYLSIGSYCREMLGPDTDVMVGFFTSNLEYEEPWIAMYGKGIRDMVNNEFDYPLSGKYTSSLPNYYRNYYAKNRGEWF